MSGQLKEVRDRIKSVKSTQQITKAMKMVSAAKLRKAQGAITQMRPYADRLDKMIKNILSNLDGDAVSSFGVERDVNAVAIVVVTTNKGLCGAFNTNVIKEVKKKLDNDYADLLAQGKVTIICVGKKGYDALKKLYTNANFNIDYIGAYAKPTFENLSEVSQYMMDRFKDGTFDHIDACYGRFKNAGLQFPTCVSYLPVSKVEITASEKTSNKTKADYIFEPGKVELLEKLIPSILHTTFQKFVLDTQASEHGARMTAMDNATENAEDLLKDLKINYNKARQEAITKELSEIVGGAAALGG